MFCKISWVNLSKFQVFLGLLKDIHILELSEVGNGLVYPSTVELQWLEH